MNFDHIERLIELAKAHDLVLLRVGEIEIETRPAPKPAESQLVPTPSLTTEGMPGDEDMLFYSTPTFDEKTEDT